MELRASAQGRELFRGKSAASVDRLFVVTRRFDLHQSADGIDHVIAPLLKISKPCLRDLGRRFGGTVSGVFCHLV
jgi:hypothetical protein